MALSFRNGSCFEVHPADPVMIWTGAQGLVYGSSKDPLQTCNKRKELGEFHMSTEISELICETWNKLYWWKSGSATGFLLGTSITIFFYSRSLTHCRSFRKVNKREKGVSHYSVQRGTIEQREQVSLDSQNPTMQSYLQYSYFSHRLYLTFTFN